MIATEHALVIDASINTVWDFVQDIRNWALLFPGCKECEVIDGNHSSWIIKVGAGGLVKTVVVQVHVEEWAGPNSVLFSYRLESEPVVGGGSYTAVPVSDNSTEITLQVRVEGSGKMAPMWEAMSKPLLPKMAKSFAGKIKAEIEAPGSSLGAGDLGDSAAGSVKAQNGSADGVEKSPGVLTKAWQSIRGKS